MVENRGRRNLMRDFQKRIRTGRCRSVLALLASAVCFAGMAVAEERPRTRIDTGELVGTVEDDIAVYRGIPYAAPPVGALRWRPPRPAEPWDGVRDASSFGHACPQLKGMYPPWVDAHLDEIGIDEDCLTLNVWAPAERTDTPLPVMFYIHGGNFQFGVGSMPMYDGGILAAEGVIVVTINYRLGYLGRFAHPAMTRVQAGESLVNYGMMDQIAALEWVQRNIDGFGGDPDDVTIFGHSAGGVSVNFLMATPRSTGLFHKAIGSGQRRADRRNAACVRARHSGRGGEVARGSRRGIRGTVRDRFLD